MKENWKQVILNDYEYPFEVSDQGGIRYVKSHEPVRLFESRGYLLINAHGETLRLHRLIAKMFVHNDDPDNKTQVHHINHDTFDNRASNLEWISVSAHGHESASKRMALYDYYGETNPNNKYPRYKIVKVCELLQEGVLTGPEIADKTGLPISVVHSVLSGRNWSHISKNYDFSMHKKVIRHAKDVLDYFNNRIAHGDDFKQVIKDAIDKYDLEYNEAYDIACRIRYKFRKKGVLPYMESAAIKYPEQVVIKICELLEKGELSPIEIAKQLNVGVSTVNSIKHGRSWKNIRDRYEISTEKTTKDHSQYFDIAESYVLAKKPSRALYEEVLKDKGYSKEEAKALYYSRFAALKRKGLLNSR